MKPADAAVLVGAVFLPTGLPGFNPDAAANHALPGLCHVNVVHHAAALIIGFGVHETITKESV